MPNPQVNLSQPTNPQNPFIGESFDLTLSFENTGGNPGFGPFTVLYLDSTGTDGNDGVTFNSASYLGAPLVPVEIILSGNATETITVFGEDYDVIVPAGFQAGDTLVVLELPFGSFVPGQPTAQIDINLDGSNFADLNQPLNIETQGGFVFGDSETGVPENDAIVGTSDDILVTPQLATIRKNYLGPEDETATGPNFPQQYEIVVDIAPGQTIEDLDITDFLPDTMQFVDVVSIVDASGSPIPAGNITNVASPDDGGLGTQDSLDAGGDGVPLPGGTLTRRINSVTGTGNRDVVVTVEFFVPRLDANGVEILNANDGDDLFDQNQAQLGNNLGDGNNWNPADPGDSDEEVFISPTFNDGTPDPSDPAGPDADGNSDTGLTGAGDDSDNPDPSTFGDNDHLTDPDHVLEEQSIAIQKSVVNTSGSNSFAPNDVLEYTIEFQVSDYFAFEDVIVEDLFSDGQRFNDGFTPKLTFNEHNATASNLDFSFSGYSQVGTNPGDIGGVSNNGSGDFLVIDETDINNPVVSEPSGDTKLTFKVSELLAASGQDGQLVGGGVPDGGFGGAALNNNPPLNFSGTTGTITFQTIIQDNYSDVFPSGDISVDASDRLENDAIIDGAVLDVEDLTANGFREEDDTHAEIQIAGGDLYKSIYAINGQVAPNAATDTNTSNGIAGFTSGIDVAPGDEITYRVTHVLPFTDVEDFSLEDFFPLPVFDVNDFSGVTATSINDSLPTDASVPGSGLIEYGPLHDFPQLASGVVLNPATNSYRVDFGSFDSPSNGSGVVDLLFTIPIQDNPAADGLLFTNQAHQEQSNTFNESISDDAIVQINLRQPDLSLTKGIVGFSSDSTDITFDPTTIGPSTATFAGTPGAGDAFGGNVVSADNDTTTDNLATNPIDSNLLGGLEAGDTVTFAITLENLGGSNKGAFDVTIQDDLPAGFVNPIGGSTPLNLQVNDGNGGVLSYTGAETDLFGAGIVLDDNPGPDSDPSTDVDNEGAIDGYELNSSDNQTNPGANIAIVTFDLEVDEDAAFIQSSNNGNEEELLNTARVTYANTEGGTPADEEEDTATVEVNTPEAHKYFISTSESSTSGRDVTIGEVVRYRLVVKVPEGQTDNLILRDNLPDGMTFLNDGSAKYTFVSNSGGITSSDPGGTSLSLGLSPTNFDAQDQVGSASGDDERDINQDDEIPANDPAWLSLPDENIGSSSNANDTVSSTTTNLDTYNSGSNVFFKLGAITNSDRDSDEEFVVVEFNALVDNAGIVDDQGTVDVSDDTTQYNGNDDRWLGKWWFRYPQSS